MDRKLSLDLDTLAVDSFETSPGAEDVRGTVRAHADTARADTARADTAAPDGKDCTCNNTCLCETAYYNCGTGPFTIYSCDYTYNRSCAY